MLLYLPIYYPPASPTHQLVYVPPAPSQSSHSSVSMSTPPLSPNATIPPHHARSRRPVAAHTTVPSHLWTPITSTPPSAWRQPMQPVPYYMPPTPTSSSSEIGIHHPRPRPLPTTHNSAPVLSVFDDASYDPDCISPNLTIPPDILSHADLLSRTKIRSCHSATDHDCVLRKYELTMRQQPVQARMCGVGEKCESTQSHAHPQSAWCLPHRDSALCAYLG
jgi:hypothetical protein